MAKLEGVKVIDMQDGEITKIAYGGEEYAYTNTEEERGDIALVVDDWGVQKLGEYYDVIKSDHHFYDNDSDEYVHIQGKKEHASCFRRRVRLFRKVSAPTITERVDELETRVSALEAEESLVGKYVVFHDRKGTATVGKYYEITGILECGGRTYAEYTIEVGEEGNVAYPPSESAYDYEIFDEKPAEKPSIKVGDCAKVVGRTHFSDIGEGTIVKITRTLDVDGEHRIDLLDESDHDYAKPEALEKIELSEADLVFIENGREPGEYKKGDIVGGSLWNDSNDTFFGVVVDVSDTMVGVRVPNGRYYGAYKKDVKPYAFVEKRADKIV